MLIQFRLSHNGEFYATFSSRDCSHGFWRSSILSCTINRSGFGFEIFWSKMHSLKSTISWEKSRIPINNFQSFVVREEKRPSTLKFKLKSLLLFWIFFILKKYLTKIWTKMFSLISKLFKSVSQRCRSCVTLQTKSCKAATLNVNIRKIDKNIRGAFWWKGKMKINVFLVGFHKFRFSSSTVFLPF